jgi:hypothetical protein
MDAVYRKKKPGQRTTWIDRFIALEPEDGFLAVARQVWKREAELKR